MNTTYAFKVQNDFDQVLEVRYSIEEGYTLVLNENNFTVPETDINKIIETIKELPNYSK